MKQDYLSQLRLLQLVSPTLPVGAYAYSQGLEYAVEVGWVKDIQSLEEWLHGLMSTSLLYVDLPFLQRIFLAWCKNDLAAVKRWSMLLTAQRETYELRLDERNRGEALAKLLIGLEIVEAEDWLHCPYTSFISLFGLACAKWSIEQTQMLQGYLWSWLENQVIVGVKLIPLGQLAGQRILIKLSQHIPEITQHSLDISDDELGYSLPGFSIASCLHETQYTRLFRS